MVRVTKKIHRNVSPEDGTEVLCRDVGEGWGLVQGGDSNSAKISIL